MLIAFSFAYQAMIVGLNVVLFVVAFFVIRKFFRWVQGKPGATPKRVNKEKDLW